MKPVATSLIIFLFAWGILLGTAYNTFVHYDFSYAIDTQGYLRMAQGEKNNSLTRRYRVLVPWAAGLVAYPLQQVMGKVWPHRADSDWPYRLGFLIVNSILMALLGLLLYHIACCYGLSPPTAIISMLAVLSSRWANYATALPLTDSLYYLLVALLIYGIKKPRFNWMLIVALLLGPLAKESFLLLLPLPLLYSSMSRWKQISWIGLGIILAFIVRYWLDQYYGLPMSKSVDNALAHWDNISLALQRIFALRGIGELMTILGGFSLIVISGFFGGQEARSKWLRKIDGLLWLLLLIALAHALISSSVARMLYLATPFWVVALGGVMEWHPWWRGWRRLMRINLF